MGGVGGVSYGGGGRCAIRLGRPGEVVGGRRLVAARTGAKRARSVVKAAPCATRIGRAGRLVSARRGM